MGKFAAVGAGGEGAEVGFAAVRAWARGEEGWERAGAREWASVGGRERERASERGGGRGRDARGCGAREGDGREVL